MDTLPGHFIRYISPAPGQLIELLVDTLGSEFGRVLFSEMPFCRFWLLTSVGFPSSQTGLHILTDSIFFVSFFLFLHRAAATWLIVRTSNDAFYLINNSVLFVREALTSCSFWKTFEVITEILYSASSPATHYF